MSRKGSKYNLRVPSQAIDDLNDMLIHGKWKYRFHYGGNDRINPCIRVQRNSTSNNPLKNYIVNGHKITFGSNTIRAYQASYIAHYRRTPRKGKTVSHICGRPKKAKDYFDSWSACIEPTHLRQETIQENNKRKTCHLFIRHYTDYQNWDWENIENDKVIFVDDVPGNIKVKIAKLYIKGKATDMEAMEDYKCECTKKCFITYGKRKYVNVDQSSDEDDDDDSDFYLE